MLQGAGNKRRGGLNIMTVPTTEPLTKKGDKLIF
jgi:hypothetical protein